MGLGVFLLSGVCRGADLQEILKRGTAAIQSDWAADPLYACVERDETRKDGKLTSKTSEVVMIEGSDYSVPLAVDDQPLSPVRQKAELVKLKEEIQKRRRESPAERERRIAAYKKQRDENGELLLGFPQAFIFQVTGEDTKNGNPAYVLSAAPKARSGSVTRAQKVLSGMEGTAWIEKNGFHAIQVDVHVVRPVPVFGMLATVLPGTEIEFGMTPVSDSVWLVNEVSMNLTVSKLHMFKSEQVTRSTYAQYRRNDEVLKELLAKAGA
jgi:hypothetical protein